MRRTNARLRGFNCLYRKGRIDTYSQYREYLDFKHDYSEVNDYGDPYNNEDMFIILGGSDRYPIVIYIDNGEEISKRYIM